MNVREVFERFSRSIGEKQPRVLVVGDLMLDTYLNGSINRISPEAPVPVVLENGREFKVGGAGNVAINASALGAEVHLMAIVGEDDNARILEDLLAKKGVAHYLERVVGSPTVEKCRVMTNNQQVLRIDSENGFSAWDATEFIATFERLVGDFDVVVLADYAKGTLQIAPQIIEKCNRLGVRTLVDPKDANFKKYGGASLVTPNMREFEAAVGVCHSESEILSKGRSLMEASNISQILLTRSEKGMSLLDPSDAPQTVAALAREVYDVTGAGDTVIACMAVCMASGLDDSESMTLSNVAASVVVGKLGTSSVSRRRLEAEVYVGESATARIASSREQLRDLLDERRRRGDSIVMTNGCFDILHAGHIAYLHKAASLGGCLVVLVNGDESVSRLKGPTRPINSASNRVKVVSSLRFVDVVFCFDEDDPGDIYRELMPDVLVKGADYKVDEIAGGADVLAGGGKVETLNYVEGISTTKMVEKIINDAKSPPLSEEKYSND